MSYTTLRREACSLVALYPIAVEGPLRSRLAARACLGIMPGSRRTRKQPRRFQSREAPGVIWAYVCNIEQTAQKPADYAAVR